MQHLACIMDGNRRFAKKHGWKPWVGHDKGVETVRTAIEFCIQQAISHLTLYTFSLENFKRQEDEKTHLFELLVSRVTKDIDELVEKGIKVRFIGDRTLFPACIIDAVDHLAAVTSAGEKLQVNLLFCYGGKQEILQAARITAEQVVSGNLRPEELDENHFKRNLWLGDVPPPDLIIRTGGIYRLSNFLSFQSVYSELYFSDALWPEFTRDHFQQAYDAYTLRIRNYGS